MIRKSVETRDWLHTMEPRSVRSVMKRVVEEVTLLDKQVATLYEEGTKKEQGSGEWLYTPFSPVSARGARCVSDNVRECVTVVSAIGCVLQRVAADIHIPTV